MPGPAHLAFIMENVTSRIKGSYHTKKTRIASGFMDTVYVERRAPWQWESVTEEREQTGVGYFVDF